MKAKVQGKTVDRIEMKVYKIGRFKWALYNMVTSLSFNYIVG